MKSVFGKFCTAAALSFFAGFAQGQTYSLENPQPNSYQSGIGVFSGWACSTNVQVLVDGVAYRAAAGTPRSGFPSTLCNGNANVNFALLRNFNNFGNGTHSAQLMIDGVPVGAIVPFTVTVPVPSSPFATGLSSTVSVPNFPTAGKTTTLIWQEASQNFAISAVTTSSTPVTACARTNFTKAAYDAITLGMSFAQVTSVIGCVNDPASTQHQGTFTIYNWRWLNASPYQLMWISVWFDAAGTTVVDAYDGQASTPYFKSSYGF